MRAILPGLALLCLVSTIAAAGTVADTGARDFASRCAPCHGLDARGDGPAAASLKKKPADLTAIAKRYGGFPEERIFDTIAGLDMPDAHGSREMPVWGDVFVTEAIGKSVRLEDALKASDAATRRIVALLAYIETIQAKP